MSNKPTNAPALRIQTALFEFARKQGLTQKQIAEKSGLSEQTVSRLATEKNVGTLPTLFQIADGIGASIIVVPSND